MEVSIRELKANPARAIALMQQGERVQITSHRKVVAELVRPENPAEPVIAMTDEVAMQKLLASGLVAEPATRPFKLPQSIDHFGSRSPMTKSLMVLPSGEAGNTPAQRATGHCALSASTIGKQLVDVLF